MKTYSNILCLLIASAVVISCQKNDVSRSQNEAAKDSNIVRANPGLGETIKSLNSLDLKKLEDDSLHFTDADSLLDLLKNLSGFVLNKNFVEDHEVRQSNSMRSLLADFNQAALKLHQMTPNSTKLEGFLLKYRELAFSGCDSQA